METEALREDVLLIRHVIHSEDNIPHILDDGRRYIIYDSSLESFKTPTTVEFLSNKYDVSVFMSSNVNHWFFNNDPSSSNILSDEYPAKVLAKYYLGNILVLGFDINTPTGRELLMQIVNTMEEETNLDTSMSMGKIRHFTRQHSEHANHCVNTLDREIRNTQTKREKFSKLVRNIRTELFKVLEYAAALNVSLKAINECEICITFHNVIIPASDYHSEVIFGDIDFCLDYRPSFYSNLRPKVFLKRSGDLFPTTYYFHPHINDSGSMCFGSLNSDIYNCASEGEFVKLITCVRECLSSYNPRDRFQDIREFGAEIYHDDEEDDEENDYCDDCSNRHSAFCFFECNDNEGRWECEEYCDHVGTALCIGVCDGVESFRYVHSDCSCRDAENGCENCVYHDVCVVAVDSFEEPVVVEDAENNQVAG